MSTPLPPANPGYGIALGDVATTTRAINNALTALSPTERGALTLQLNRSGVGAGLIVRGPFNTAFLGTVGRSAAGTLDWQVAGRVAFAADLGPAESEPVRPSDLKAFHALLRVFGNGPIRAARKTWLAAQGRAVPLLP